jgi:hypothetical protein
MFRNYVFTLFVLSLLVMGRAATARAGGGVAPSYPTWAAAVVQPYPNCLPGLSGPVIPTMYGIATPDSLPTVVAWYKSRVHGAWAGSEGGNTWSVKSGGVRIQISRNFYDDSGNEKPGTRVALTRYR